MNTLSCAKHIGDVHMILFDEHFIDAECSPPPNPLPPPPLIALH